MGDPRRPGAAHRVRRHSPHHLAAAAGWTGTVIGEKAAWRKGFGSDAMRVRTKFAFETLGLHRLESEARIDNIASQRAWEKAGYRREGIARKKLFWGGTWYDTVLYGMLNEDYFAGAPSLASLARGGAR